MLGVAMQMCGMCSSCADVFVLVFRELVTIKKKTLQHVGRKRNVKPWWSLFIMQNNGAVLRAAPVYSTSCEAV